MSGIWDILPFNVLEILRSLEEAGGQPYFVGGTVRDFLMENPPKDIDVEVYGLSPEEIIEVIEPWGRVDTVGKSFGVILLVMRNPNLNIEFSIPRRENKVGRGHKGFMVDVDPTMTLEEAASRRDFTVNSIMLDPFSEEIIDNYEGMVDLINGTLRPVSDKFMEDPLRVLRGMQFAGRFDMIASLELVDMAQQMIAEYSELSKDRVWGEWYKWALKSTVPSAGLELLRATGWLELYPQLDRLRWCPQDYKWHPEGDVFEHIKLVVDEVARISERENLDKESKLILMFSGLLHDIGKPYTTQLREDGRVISPGHADKGADMVVPFLISIGSPKWLWDPVITLTRDHMFRATPEVKRSTIRRLARRLEPSSVRMLALLQEADINGRGRDPAGHRDESIHRMVRLAEEVKAIDAKPEPILMGRHLIDEGLEPGPDFGMILDDAYEAQLNGEFEDLEGALNWFRDRIDQAVGEWINR